MVTAEEHRGAERVVPESGQAYCLHGPCSRQYVVDDFSQRGARLRGNAPPPIGTRIKTVMWVGGQGLAQAWGRVARHCADGKAFGVQFEGLNAMDRLLLDQLVTRVRLENAGSAI